MNKKRFTQPHFLINKRNTYGLFKSGAGFTLLELLLVIAIVGILSSVTVTNLSQLKAKARDANRISDVEQIQKVVEIYFDDHGEYPNTPCYGLPAIVICSSALNPGVWISDLNMTLPNDPIHGQEGHISDYTDDVHSYIFTRSATGSPEKYYYILFKREAGAQTEECEGFPFNGWSCIGGGELP